MTLELLPLIRAGGRISEQTQRLVGARSRAVLNTSISLWDAQPIRAANLDSHDILKSLKDGDEFRRVASS